MAKGLKTNNMSNTPFKMKGSPFQRNFGIGSPVKKTYKEAYADADQEKYDTYEKFETAAKAWNTKKYGTTEPTRDAAKAGKTKVELAKSHAATTKTTTPEEKTTPKISSDSTVSPEPKKKLTVKEAKSSKKAGIRDAKQKGYETRKDRRAAIKEARKTGKDKVKTARKDRNETSTRKSRRLTKKVKKQTGIIYSEEQNSPRGLKVHDKRKITQAKLDVEKNKIAQDRA